MTRTLLTPEQDEAMRASLAAALAAGSSVLERGGAALDAVEAAVCALEDDPNFNAGRGAVLTFEGNIRHDAAIMDGATRDAGAVAELYDITNPVRAARAVMDDSPHVLLSGAGAHTFAIEQALPTSPQSYFETPERRRQLDELRANKVGWYDVDLKYGTVGAVALDVNGHVAAATSTGGLTGKRWGRIGDTPLIGAGTYADDRACAVSATGAGEFFIREGVAHEICARIRMLGETAFQAAKVVMADVKAMGGVGGVIMVSPNGEADWHFTTPGMYRARIAEGGAPVIAIYGDE
jgi:L-asparaginase / beta-aspartyl-peptidase